MTLLLHRLPGRAAERLARGAPRAARPSHRHASGAAAVELHCEVKTASNSSSTAPPLVCLHGLMGSCSNWRTLGLQLSKRTGRPVVVPDARNHGRSPHTGSMGYEAMAADTVALMHSLGYESGGWGVIGHSMGAKTAMAVALQHPESVGQLVAVDAAPVAYTEIREIHEVIAAMQAVDLTGLTAIQDADARLAPLLPSELLRQFVLQNLVLRRGTEARWRVNLSGIAAALDDVAGFPEPLLGSQYGGPTLFVGGAKADRILPEHHAGITRLFPHADIESLPTGHWVQHEAPDAFLDLICPMLAYDGD